MGEKKVICPKCGSDDIIDWGTDRRMCGRCHEVFSANDALKSKGRGKVFEPRMPQVRESYLDPFETDEDTGLRGGLTLAAEAENRLESVIKEYTPEKISRMEKPEEASAIFEREHAERKKEQDDERRKSQTRYQATASRVQRSSQSYPSTQAQQTAAQKKKKSRAAIGWVVFFAVIWVVITIICSVSNR